MRNGGSGMKGFCKVIRKRRLQRLLSAVLAVFLAMAFLLPEMAGAASVQAADNTAEIANVVVFVKYQDDTRDIFNATNGSRSNWQEIKKMYDLDSDCFSNYISTVTEGKVHVTNYFPQEQSGGQRVQTLVIPRNDGNGYVVDAVVKALSDGRISVDTADKLDNRQAGILDNLTIIIQGNVTDRGEAAFKSIYAGPDKVNGLLIRNYNMIPSAKLVLENAAANVLPQQGVIAHEFLHTLGLPDLYRDSGSGDPVGIWDIMASVSCFLQYPLSYMRARQGWIPMKTIDQSGTYTLTAVSENGGDKVFVLKTPLSDSELICLEYRKRATDPNQYDYRIPTSGLLMYRVDNKVDGLTNNAGRNYVYVYRPGVTHPEAAADVGAVNRAALDVSAGETSYGTTDLDADFTQDTLYYSDGSNSGIRISDLKLSEDKNKLTFTVTFADYSQYGVWDKLDDGISGQFSEDPDICIDSATGTIYTAYTESVSGNLSNTQVRVMRWNGTGWQQVGGTIGNARLPALAVCGGEVYLSYCKGDWKSVVYCKLSGNAWGQVATYAAQYPGSMQLVVDGNEIYGAFQEDSGSGKRLVIYDIKGRKTVTNSLTTSIDFGNPAVAKSGNSFYVACAEFPSGSSQIREYNMSTGRWSTAYTIAKTFTNTHAIVKQGQKIYAFAGSSAIPGASEGGTACMAMFDGNSWSSSSVTSMKQYNAVSMDVLEGQVYLAYHDTADKKARLLRGTGTVLEQYSDGLGTGLDFLQIRGYGDSIYAAVRAENTGTMVVRRKVVTESSVTPPDSQNPRTLTLTPPAGYGDSTIYVDGVEYAAQMTGNSYQVELPDTLGKTAVMYSYNSSNIPVGMYVWKLDWKGQTCTAVPLPGLQDLLSYHGFSIRVQSPAGIRFKSGIDEGLKQQLITVGVDGCRLKEYGTLFITNENRKQYPFVKGGTKVGGGRAYWTENGQVNDKVFETVAGRNRFTSVLINLAPNMYGKDISFRAYAVLDCDGQEIIVYGPPVYRSVYTVAKQVQAKGEFSVGSSGYKYVQGIIDSVEGR